MPLIPLQILPGVVRNGTDLESANRWRDVRKSVRNSYTSKQLFKAV